MDLINGYLSEDETPKTRGVARVQALTTAPPQTTAPATTRAQPDPEKNAFARMMQNARKNPLQSNAPTRKDPRPVAAEIPSEEDEGQSDENSDASEELDGDRDGESEPALADIERKRKIKAKK